MSGSGSSSGYASQVPVSSAQAFVSGLDISFRSAGLSASAPEPPLVLEPARGRVQDHLVW
jgi:hypothetical protein